MVLLRVWVWRTAEYVYFYRLPYISPSQLVQAPSISTRPGTAGICLAGPTSLCLSPLLHISAACACMSLCVWATRLCHPNANLAFPRLAAERMRQVGKPKDENKRVDALPCFMEGTNPTFNHQITDIVILVHIGTRWCPRVFVRPILRWRALGERECSSMPLPSVVEKVAANRQRGRKGGVVCGQKINHLVDRFGLPRATPPPQSGGWLSCS